MKSAVFAKIVKQDDSLKTRGHIASRCGYEIRASLAHEIAKNYKFKSKKVAKKWLKNIKQMVEETNIAIEAKI